MGYAVLLALLGGVASLIVGKNDSPRRLAFAIGGTVIGALGLLIGVLNFGAALLVMLLVLVLGTGTEKKPARTKEEQEEMRAAGQDMFTWKCFSCGAVNENRVSYCVDCGTSRDWSAKKALEEKEKM